MPEAFSWPEGIIVIYTGNQSTSAMVAYCENIDGTLMRGIVNRETMAGQYYDYETGRRADIRFGAIWTVDSTLRKIEQSATAIHLKVMNSGIAGSGGYMLYSGRIDSLGFNGQDAGIFKYSIAAHFNVWSGF